MTLFLLVLNLLVLVIGVGVEYATRNRAPDMHEFNAEKIRFWSQPAAYKPARAAVPMRVAEAAETTEPTPLTRLCLDIADLSQAHYLEMRTVLKTVGMEGGKCTYNFDRNPGWWVFWPPEYEAVQRDKVLKAMQAVGVRDVLPISQGAMAQSFSLGMFASEAQANQHRDTLRGKGLDKVDFGPRPSMGSGRLGCVSEDPGQLNRLKAGLPNWVKPVDEQRCPALAEPGKGPGDR